MVVLFCLSTTTQSCYGSIVRTLEVLREVTVFEVFSMHMLTWHYSAWLCASVQHGRHLHVGVCSGTLWLDSGDGPLWALLSTTVHI